MQTARRTHQFTESVIREMTRVADECGAINLAQGFPDFPAPEVLKAGSRRRGSAPACTAGPPRAAKRARPIAEPPESASGKSAPVATPWAHGSSIPASRA